MKDKMEDASHLFYGVFLPRVILNLVPTAPPRPVSYYKYMSSIQVQECHSLE